MYIIIQNALFMIICGALNTGLTLFTNIQDQKGTVGEAGEVNTTKVYKQNYGDFLLNFQWVLY
jgi:hypothetical protein